MLIALRCLFLVSLFFFFNDTATTEIYTLSLHDALPICGEAHAHRRSRRALCRARARCGASRSEEHTSELQSRYNLVCRLLLEKKTIAQDAKAQQRWSGRTAGVTRESMDV